jgi:hypothetical protein
MDMCDGLHTPTVLFPEGGGENSYPLDNRLGGSQSTSGRGGEEETIPSLPCWESNPGHPAHNLVIIQCLHITFWVGYR